MNRLFALGGILALLCVASPAVAGEYIKTDDPFYWFIRDTIYANESLIAHFEANPIYDDGSKGPLIIGARAATHRLRRLVGPVRDFRREPCCYNRPPIYVR
jgi:hypothetical protein